MLVLSRKADEHVRGTITAQALREMAAQLKDKPDDTSVDLFDITVVRVSGNGVKLGFDCPRVINLVRTELCPAVQPPVK